MINQNNAFSVLRYNEIVYYRGDGINQAGFYVVVDWANGIFGGQNDSYKLAKTMSDTPFVAFRNMIIDVSECTNIAIQLRRIINPDIWSAVIK